MTKTYAQGTPRIGRNHEGCFTLSRPDGTWVASDSKQSLVTMAQREGFACYRDTDTGRLRRL